MNIERRVATAGATRAPGRGKPRTSAFATRALGAWALGTWTLWTLALGASALMAAVPASADDGVQHNITYRARVDGLARGALITYRISDAQVNSADPTMLPGRTFETTAVLTDPAEAGMRISIQWPYSANLHCEILVDGHLVVQADQFIGPRITPARNDPDYGAMNCGAPLSNAMGSPPAEPAPTDPATPPLSGLPPAGLPPADGDWQVS